MEKAEGRIFIIKRIQGDTRNKINAYHKDSDNYQVFKNEIRVARVRKKKLIKSD